MEHKETSKLLKPKNSKIWRRIVCEEVCPLLKFVNVILQQWNFLVRLTHCKQKNPPRVHRRRHFAQFHIEI